MIIHPNRASHSDIFRLIVLFIAVVCFASIGLAFDRFIDNGDGTVTDNETGLMWAKSVPSKQRNLSNAQSYAKHLSLGHHKNWRVPTRSELEGLVKVYPRPMFDVKSGVYVTSSVSGKAEHDAIYVIDINPLEYSMAVYFNGSQSFPFYVWLVRDIK